MIYWVGGGRGGASLGGMIYSTGRGEVGAGGTSASASSSTGPNHLTEYRSNADAKQMSSPSATIRLKQAQFHTKPYRTYHHGVTVTWQDFGHTRAAAAQR